MRRLLQALLRLSQREEASGLALIAATALALVWANSTAGDSYAALVHLPLSLAIGGWSVAADSHFVVDDGLMALFFLLVGLEIRHELTVGELASWRRAAAPVAGAIGGMAVPAAIFVAFNWHDPAALRGWAVPIATDIAFSLTVLRLLGARVPAGLRVFLTALAIIDDLGAILVIALFYTDALSLPALAAAAAVLAILFGLGRVRRGRAPSVQPYLLGFAALWVCLARSGIHATLAGVAIALVIPMHGAASPGRRLERALHPWVAFLVLPLFGLFNAGLRFDSLHVSLLLDPLVAGVALGLLLGKPLGVSGATGLALRLRLAQLPAGLAFRHIMGAAVLCGIGFTMSLFIGHLAFATDAQQVKVKVAVLGASLLAALLGALALLLPYSASPARR